MGGQGLACGGHPVGLPRSRPSNRAYAEIEDNLALMESGMAFRAYAERAARRGPAFALRGDAHRLVGWLWQPGVQAPSEVSSCEGDDRPRRSRSVTPTTMSAAGTR